MDINLTDLPQTPELLHKRIHALHASFQSELEKSQKEKEGLHLEINLLKKEISTAEQRYARLLEEIRLTKQRHFGRSSEKDACQRELFDEPGTVELSAEVQAQLAQTVTVSSHQRSKHPVRRPLPSDLPRETLVYDIPEAEKICSCGTSLVCIGEDASEQLKYIPAKLSVVRHVRLKYACRPCQENVKIAPPPLLLLPKSIATPELVAYTIIAKYSDSLPLYRQEAIWQRLGIDLPRSSLCGWLMKTAQCCAALSEALRNEIIRYDYTQADETRLQVLQEKGRADTASSFMWVYRSANAGRTSILFDYQETRGGYHAQQMLGGFKGYLQCDAYSGYNWSEPHPHITRLGCMAHARRSFAELAKLTKTPGLAHQALQFFAKLYAIEKQAREEHHTPAQRHQLRNSQAPPILAAFKVWLTQCLPRTSVSHKLGKAIAYMLNRWDTLTAYLTDGRLEIDNNLIENAIRPFAVGRKNWLFAGSPEGAKAGALYYSLIETCKANGIEPYRYLVRMLHNIRLCTSPEDYRQLLPQFIVL